MRNIGSKLQRQVVKLLACAVILKVTASVVLAYQAYMPPDFESGFLQGREAYFWGGYQWAFYLHIASGPCTLIFGIVLMSERFRQRFSSWHRILGRIQVASVLLLVSPSGIWMAVYSQTGIVAGLGFALLGVATGLCAWLGWMSAVNRRFTEHRCWMSRCYLLLCSAVVLRLVGGAFTVAEVEGEWTYPFAAWASWLVPLAVFEILRVKNKSTSFDAERNPQPSS